MAAQAHRLSPIDLLERLVGFATVSDASNLDLIDFVASYLASHGIDSVRFPSPCGSKAALFASVGPSDRGGVLLSGHTDVVPVSGQVWTSDPFTLRLADGKAYGRGAVDMKAFCALAIDALIEWRDAPLTTPLHLLLSYDEETTCLGSTAAIARFGRDLPRPTAIIVGEPTLLEVADAHKSVVTFETHVGGRAWHSSSPALGANAISAGAAIVAELDAISDEMMARGDPSGRFDPPYVTVHVGIFEGGNARNIVPKHARLAWEFRGLPGFDPAEIPVRLEAAVRARILPKLQATAPEANITTTLGVAVPMLAPDPGSTAETLALRLAGRNGTVTVPFGTEAGHFQAAGLPTVVCGPGSILQAHQPDEFITLEQIAAGTAFMSRLGDWCSG